MGGVDDARQLQQAREQQAQQDRAAILAKTHGGHEGPTGYTTDFAASSMGGLDGLRAMIEHADPEALSTVAGSWTAVHKALLAAQSDFRTHTTAALENWTGTAADSFAARAQQLSDSLGNGALYADNASKGVAAAATALTTAKNTMPTAPSEWQKISRKATSEAGDQQFNADLKAGISRQVTLDLDGGQLSATEERYQQAIVVMEALEAQYNSAAETVGKPPGDMEDVTVWPPPPAAVAHDPVGGPDGQPVEAPGTAGPLNLRQDGTSDSGGSTYGLAPGQAGPGTVVGGATTGAGITGGERQSTPSGQGTTITGISGGLGSGSAGGVGDVGGAAGGTIPMGGSGGGGQSRSGSGFGIADVAAGFGAVGSGGAGAFGLAARADDFAATSASAGSGAVTGGDESVDQPRTGPTGGSAEDEIAMGGFPGGLGSQDRKRKRRPRPHYLMEDPESWASGVIVNPPVIM
jgi:uncharacterized protein YukE